MKTLSFSVFEFCLNDQDKHHQAAELSYEGLLTNLFANCWSRVALSTIFNPRQNWRRSLQAVLSSQKDKSRFKKSFKYFLCPYHTFLGCLVFISWCDLVRMRMSMQRGEINPWKPNYNIKKQNLLSCPYKSPSVIISLILITSGVECALILQGEIWCWSSLRHKGLLDLGRSKTC